MSYLNRVFDVQLSEYLDAFGAVLIEGPKWCGKTTTATQHAQSVLKMQNSDTLEATMKTIQVKPAVAVGRHHSHVRPTKRNCSWQGIISPPSARRISRMSME